MEAAHNPLTSISGATEGASLTQLRTRSEKSDNFPTGAFLSMVGSTKVERAEPDEVTDTELGTAR